MDKRIFFLVVVLVIWCFFACFFSKCWHGGSTGTESHESTLLAKDGDNLIAEAETAHFNFRNSGDSYMTPLSAGVTGVVDKTVNYLKSNPAKAVQITGWYTEKETNSSRMQNLGLARASHVKRLFTNKGIPDGQLTTDGQIENDMVFLGDTLLKGPITLSIIEKPNTGIDYATLKQKFQGNPVVVQFDTSNDHPSLDSDQRKDIGDLIYYIKNVPNSSIDISGHSDNRGNRNSNIAKSEERAKFIKDYLVDNGLVAARANVIAIGPDKPIATNNTSAGRAQNRRVEITLN